MLNHVEGQGRGTYQRFTEYILTTVTIVSELAKLLQAKSTVTQSHYRFIYLQGQATGKGRRVALSMSSSSGMAPLHCPRADLKFTIEAVFPDLHSSPLRGEAVFFKQLFRCCKHHFCSRTGKNLVIWPYLNAWV